MKLLSFENFCKKILNIKLTPAQKDYMSLQTISDWLLNNKGHEITINRSREIKPGFSVRLSGTCGYENIYGVADTSTIELSFQQASKNYDSNLAEHKRKRKIAIHEHIVHLNDELDSLKD